MNVILIRAGVAESVIVVADDGGLEFAQTLGYEDVKVVTPANRVAGGWLVNGVNYPDKPRSVERINEQSMRDLADGALVDLRTERDRNYAGLTAAQAIAALVPAVKLLTRVAIILIRFQIAKFDSTD